MLSQQGPHVNYAHTRAHTYIHSEPNDALVKSRGNLVHANVCDSINVYMYACARARACYIYICICICICIYQSTKNRCLCVHFILYSRDYLNSNMNA